LTLAAVLLATAAIHTGQSPACERFCVSVKPREAPEGTVFVFRGRGWRPNRHVTATFGAYCRPGEACIDIAYFARLRTGDRGGFRFRLRAGAERAGDDGHGIRSGSSPIFSQRAHGRTVRRQPRYHVIVPG
jgi:hypothetical protein